MMEAPSSQKKDLSGMDLLNVKEPVVRPRHVPWYPPQHTACNLASLRVMNSLTESVEPFVPRDGRNISWYTCGPTVYDVAHMGHARAYLTFDIVRRILEDYFGFPVKYVMNITDIDDKIIKTARINKLLHDFRAEIGENFVALRDFVAQALGRAESLLQKKAEKLNEPLAASTSKRVVEEREEQLKQLQLKQDQLQALKDAVQSAVAAGSVNELFEAARGVIGDALDESRGSTVSDHNIFEQHARKYERAFFEDCERLGIRQPDVITRVTEFVPQIVAFVQAILANGFGYVGKTSVFFDTEAFQAAGHDYAKLKGISSDRTTEAEMAEGEGALASVLEGEKKNSNDFALWKFSKPGEPKWPSPWGEGRPGWHIECSVMASSLLGRNIDIHAGGCDLKFPHHDNELAQSEAFWKHHQWINYFLHCGHLHIKGLKMSKSLKNFITIRKAFEEGVTSREIRLLFLLNDWSKPMNFSDQSLSEARERERVLRAFFGSLDIVFRGDALAHPQGYNPDDAALSEGLTATDTAVHEALCNNFDTPTAMAALFDLVTRTNAYLLSIERPSATLLRKVGRYVSRIFRVFGVFSGPSEVPSGFAEGSGADSASSGKTVPVIDCLVQFRDEVRKGLREKWEPRRLLEACDALRDVTLPPLGIRLEDKPDGSLTQWKWDDPEILRREQEARRELLQRQVAEKKKKLANIIDTKRKLLRKWLQYVAPPHEYFRAGLEGSAKYGEFDESGMPTRDAAGVPLNEKQLKKLKKEVDKYTEGFNELQSKGGATLIRGIECEIAELQRQIEE